METNKIFELLDDDEEIWILFRGFTNIFTPKRKEPLGNK